MLKVYYTLENPGALYLKPLQAVTVWPQAVYASQIRQWGPRTGLWTVKAKGMREPELVTTKAIFGVHAGRIVHAMEARMHKGSYLDRNLTVKEREGTWEAAKNEIARGRGGFLKVVLAESYGDSNPPVDVALTPRLALNEAQYAILGWLSNHSEWSSEWKALCNAAPARRRYGSRTYRTYGWDWENNCAAPFVFRDYYGVTGKPSTK